MSNRDENDEVARLERLNDELGDSLRRCRKLLHDYEVRLAANSNEVQAARDADDEEQREA